MPARPACGSASPAAPPQSPEDNRIPTRIGLFGPLTYQNDNVLLDRLGSDGVAKIILFQPVASRFTDVPDKPALPSYEVLNFVNSRRSIRATSPAAEFGPIPVSPVANFLDACRLAGILTYTH